MTFIQRSCTTVLAAYYAVQGIPMGFISLGFTAYLAGSGVSTRAVAGFLAAAWSPWILKLVFAPMLDRFQESRMGRRRPWLLIAQTGMAVSACAMLLIPDPLKYLMALTVIISIHNSFGSLQDVTIDAIAVDTLKAGERGRANAFMWTGKIVGMSIGAAGAGTILAHTSWHVAASVVCIPSAVAALVTLFLRERTQDVRFCLAVNDKGRPTSHRQSRILLTRLFRALKSPQAAWLALIALVGSLPARMLITLAPNFAVNDIGWTESAFSQFAGGPVLLAGAAGAMAGGWISDRISRKWTMYAGTLLVGLFLLFLGAFDSWWHVPQVVSVAILGITSADMMVRITLFSSYMAVCQQEIAATQYTLYMALSNMCNVVGSGVVAILGVWAGASTIFIAAAAFCVLVVIIIRQVPLVQ